MTFEQWWRSKYEETKHVSEADYLLMQEAYEAGQRAEKERCAAIADSMRVEGAIPDTSESEQDWCARYIAEEIRGEPPASNKTTDTTEG